ncbi:gastrula zinc finger protein XlCGF26.1 [Dendroctonus ponderosae]|uniref:gastrula zinc finger protein XlCGF26.1 n=1 Tax=Dendroctonus ponderosae TaxID=77166 RepID=UPI0020353990|nr:gastrula zinc finger protein XlCGF26.1 [Dendroctonus ponderosae]
MIDKKSSTMGKSVGEKVCCVCLSAGFNFNKLTTKDGSKVTLLTKFRMCISEVVWLPCFYICTDCTEILDTVHSFREKCIKTDRIRREEQAKHAEQTSSEIAIKDSPCESNSIQDARTKAEDSQTGINEALECNSDCENDGSSHSSENDQENGELDRKPKKNIVAFKSSRILRRKRNRKFACYKCEKSFTASTKLVSHCVKDHQMESKNIKPFACDSCPQRFSSSSNLWQHVKYHDGVKSSICLYCGKGFITKTDLLNHEKKHLNMREYKCESCSKSFNTHKDIRSHRLIVHTDSSKWKYICEICTKPFPIKSNYDSHMRRHMGDKKFACHLCEKKFTTKCDLQRHTRSHSDVREHQCSYCDKEYKDERVLKVHMAKLHGIGKVKIPVRTRNYVCHFCPKAYFAKNKLTRHLYTHSGEKPFKCPICDKKFNDKSYVKQHLKNSHNVDSQDAEKTKLCYLGVSEVKQELAQFNM